MFAKPLLSFVGSGSGYDHTKPDKFKYGVFAEKTNKRFSVHTMPGIYSFSNCFTLHIEKTLPYHVLHQSTKHGR